MKSENAATLVNAFPSILKPMLAKYKNPKPEVGLCVGDGWYAILFDICYHVREIQSQIPSIEFVPLQIKEKFGGLRFYYTAKYHDEGWGSKTFRKIDEWIRTQMCKHGYAKPYWALTRFRKRYIYRTVLEKVERIVQKGEAESYTTCEQCGEPGKRVAPGHWIQTLCEEHEEQAKQEWEKSL